MTIAVTPIHQSHAWNARLNLQGAPATPRTYGSGALYPEWVELSYRGLDGGPLRLHVVRLHGTEVETGRKMSDAFFDPERLPAWLTPIIDRYKPPGDTSSGPVDTATSVH